MFVLGGDVFWWVYLQGLCLVVMLYRLYAAPFVSCFVYTLRLARMAFNNMGLANKCPKDIV